LYYSIAILAAPIARSFSVEKTSVFAVFTLALLVSGFAAPIVGRLIDRYGGRPVLSAGSLLSCAAFVLMAAAQSPGVFVLAWLIGGAAMSTSLYDAAFASLHGLVPKSSYRTSVTILTLFGGFASTVFWPFTGFMEEAGAWRSALLVFAALHFLVTLPIHVFAVPKPEPRGRDQRTPRPKTARVRYRDPRYLALTVGFAAAAFIFAALSAYSIPLLTEGGLSTEQVLFATALIGPMQVFGRLLEWAFAKKMPIRSVGFLTHGLMIVSMILLGFVGDSMILGLAFAASYGLANGVMTIVRGTIPTSLFDDGKAGAILGGIAFPSFVARALAPTIFASVDQTARGAIPGVAILAALALVALICYAVAVLYRGKPDRIATID